MTATQSTIIGKREYELTADGVSIVDFEIPIYVEPSRSESASGRADLALDMDKHMTDLAQQLRAAADAIDPAAQG